MNIGNWSFRPGFVTSVIAFVVLLALLALGGWQLDRAAQKQALFEQFQEREKKPPIVLNSSVTRDPKAILWRRASARGQYHERLQILLDNQIYQGRAGYYVFSPLKISGFGEWILVNRGWVPAGAYRSSLPVIETPDVTVSVSGSIKRPPYSGLLLNDRYIEKLPGGVLRTQTINIARLGEATGIDFLPYILRLDPGSATGFVRDWPPAGSGKERNLGYAFQWFMMAAVVLFIYFYLNIRKPDNDS